MDSKLFASLLKLMGGVVEFKGQPFENMRPLFKLLSEGQNPDVFFITCSDSRVDQNLITQTQPGGLFATKNVGNLIPPNTKHVHEMAISSEAAAIEYALEILKVSHIIICGHSDCGAMKGLSMPSLEASLPAVFAWLAHARPILEDIKNHPDFSDNDFIKLQLITKQNVLKQIEHLKTYPVVAKKLARKDLILHGWYYDIESGNIFVYESQENDFIPIKIPLKRAIEKRRDEIVYDISINYLTPLTSPKTASDYQALMRMFGLLRENLSVIWGDIKKQVSQILLSELGSIYPNANDPEFIAIVDAGSRIKLDRLSDFQENVQKSKGYRNYCSKLIRQTGFLKCPSPPKEGIYSSCNDVPEHWVSHEIRR